MFKNLFNIIKLQDSNHTGGMSKNNRKSYLMKRHNMLPVANFLPPNTHWNREITV